MGGYLTTIVALLTLIGFSVNDKVVVFDHVRENLSRGQTVGFPAVVDRSLNQVLARCIFTSGTTLAALVPMAIWSGGICASDDRRRGYCNSLVDIRGGSAAGLDGRAHASINGCHTVISLAPRGPPCGACSRQARVPSYALISAT
jgi:hypothetical protein